MGVTEVTLSSLMHFSMLKRRSTLFLRRFAGDFFVGRLRSLNLPLAVWRYRLSSLRAADFYDQLGRENTWLYTILR